MSERTRQLDLERRFSQLRVVIVGLPGSGKSTLIESFTVRPNYLSLGDITRAELRDGGPMAGAIRSKFQTTEPWPAEFVVRIVAPHILRARDDGKGFVLDGVPRKASEAVALTQYTRANRLTIDLLLHLQIDAKLALERIKTRDDTARLETIGHYESRINAYLAEEVVMLGIMRNRAIENLTIDTNGNSPASARDLLLDFVFSHF